MERVRFRTQFQFQFSADPFAFVMSAKATSEPSVSPTRPAGFKAPKDDRLNRQKACLFDRYRLAIDGEQDFVVDDTKLRNDLPLSIQELNIEVLGIDDQVQPEQPAYGEQTREYPTHPHTIRP